MKVFKLKLKEPYDYIITDNYEKLCLRIPTLSTHLSDPLQLNNFFSFNNFIAVGIETSQEISDYLDKNSTPDLLDEYLEELKKARDLNNQDITLLRSYNWGNKVP
jgi:hypothetical protein